MQVFIGRHRHPFVKLILRDKAKAIPLVCMIDTGFAGGIAIPKRLEENFAWPAITSQEWKLADGSSVILDVYRGQVEFQKDKIEDLGAIFVDGDEGLVGIEFLMDKRFVLDISQNLVSLELDAGERQAGGVVEV